MEHFLYFNESTVREFLVFEGRGPKTKDYEYVVALAMHKFCEKQWDEQCEIGFPITSETNRSVGNEGLMDFSKLTSLLRKGLEEDSPVDLAIRSKERSVSGCQREVIFSYQERSEYFRLDWDECWNGSLFQHSSCFVCCLFRDRSYLSAFTSDFK